MYEWVSLSLWLELFGQYHTQCYAYICYYLKETGRQESQQQESDIIEYRLQKEHPAVVV